MSRSVANGACAIAAALALALPLQAQSPLEFGVGATRNSSPADGLSGANCAADVAWAGEGRVGLRLGSAVRLEGTAGYNFDTGVVCVDPNLGIPPTGPFDLSRREPTVSGYPFISTDARLSFEPSQPAGGVWFRAFGGYGRMWGPGVNYWLAGGGLVFGGGLATILEAEWNWFKLPFDQIDEMYQDGILTSTVTTAGSESHSELRIRAGFRLSM